MTDNQSKFSFTLIELLVSLGILVVVILSAIGIYIQIIGTRQKGLGQLNIQEDGQFIMSLIVKDVRAGVVDYTNYGGGNCGTINGTTKKVEGTTPQLCLLDFSSPQNQIRYKRELDGTRGILKRCKTSDCAPAGNYQSITMTNISVERLDFYINPNTNPFTAGSTNYTHPRVTIVLKLKSLTEHKGEAPLTLQQTVPQRYELKK